MLNFIFKLMIILPIFQTWLVWNGFSIAQYIEHGLYMFFGLIIVFFIIIIKPRFHKNILLLFILFLVFISLGFLTTLIQEMLHGYISIEGIIYEVYKLSRNITVFLFAYLFQRKKEIITNIKLYFSVTILLVIVSIFQYFFGLRAYEILHFLPDQTEYKDFYNVYLRDNRTMGLMKHPSIYSAFLMVTLIILIFSTSMKVEILEKNKNQYFILLLTVVGIFISSTRSVFLLSIFIPLLLSFVFKLNKIRKVYFVLLVLSAPFLYFAVKQLIFKLWQYWYYTINMGQTETRIVYWENAIDIFKSNYLLGSGFGTWGDTSASFSNFQPFSIINSMSDSYLSHLLTEHGLNLIFIVIIVAYTLRFFYKHARTHNDNFIKCLNIIGISLLIFTVIESLKSMQLSMYENTFFMFYLFGYIFSVNNQNEIDNETEINIIEKNLYKNLLSDK